MNRPTHEVAASLGLHPSSLFLYLAEMDLSLEDIWPKVDTDWVEALKARDWQRFGRRVDHVAHAPTDRTQSSSGIHSRGALLVIEKLRRNGKWGGARVSFECLQKFTHLPAEELKVAVHELADKEFLLAHGSSGPYSLNPKRRADIERLSSQDG